MRWIIVIGAMLLLLGPLRRRLLLPLLCGYWTVIFPLVIGAAVGHWVVVRLMPGAPAWMTIAGPLMSAFMLGVAVHELFVTMFPPRRDKDVSR